MIMLFFLPFFSFLVRAAVGDDAWLNGEFLKTVQLRGGAIIAAMKKSSAASAGWAAVEHMRDWVLGTRPVTTNEQERWTR